MMIKKRHSVAEITAKLREAETLIAQGKRQQEVAGVLGISVMTFHRWRKAYAQGSEHTSQPETAVSGSLNEQELRQQRMAELQLENSRLRRLVTDLLLEKIKLEESVSTAASKGLLSGHASH